VRFYGDKAKADAVYVFVSIVSPPRVPTKISIAAATR
jgi:hypothetical protein